MFLKQSYELLIAKAEECGGKLPIRVNWILEEAGNIPTIPDFESMMTASRSRNIRFFLVFQSLQQIEKKYRGSAHIIIGNCDCIAYLNSKDMELLTYISQLANLQTLICQWRMSADQRDPATAAVEGKGRVPCLSGKKCTISYKTAYHFRLWEIHSDWRRADQAEGKAEIFSSIIRYPPIAKEKRMAFMEKLMEENQKNVPLFWEQALNDRRFSELCELNNAAPNGF